ncbi:hypothetical protein M436DRAFT_66280 [Aureobasidium namibiae CBS 147.97]|uniref:CFEM domain-containing protein n=1 Tax=Aureobasidium namibiae CBS 147.97 TaxID=1043004 RepID=A0A074WBN2_9PEZI
MQLRVYTSLAIFAATAMAASSTTSAAASASTAVDLTAGVPQCGIACVTNAVGSSGCAATDPVCLCTTGSKAFLAAGTTCLLQNSDCSATDLQTIQTIAKQRCGALLAANGDVAAANANSSGAATAASSSSTSGKAAAATGAAVQFGASIMAVGAGVLAFVI